MAINIENIVFTQDHLKSFLHLSHDRNPLHWDEQYAKKTQLSQVVVYGIASVFLALGYWSQGRAFRLLSMKAAFKKPLFLDRKYRLEITESQNKVSVTYFDGAAAQSKFVFTWAEITQKENVFQVAAEKFTPRLKPVVELKEFQAPSEFSYSFDQAGLTTFEKNYSLTLGQMPQSQWNALLWASYFVGMENPGQQALFSDFEFQFEQDLSAHTDFILTDLKYSFNEAFGYTTIIGKGTDLRSFKINAYARPFSIQYSISQIREVIGSSKRFENKSAFISGASRGFGSVLAKSFALQGGRVLMNYRTHRDEAEAVASEIKSAGGEVLLIQGDVSQESDCVRMRDEIAKEVGSFDYLVNNASAPIKSKNFLEQNPDEFLSYLTESVAMYSRPSFYLVPLLAPQATVLNISSIYTQKLQPLFSHYIAAKSAIEGFTRALALEFKEIQFVIARPPKMLTDQTNVLGDSEKPLSAIYVAKNLWDELTEIKSPGNYHEIL